MIISPSLKLFCEGTEYSTVKLLWDVRLGCLSFEQINCQMKCGGHGLWGLGKSAAGRRICPGAQPSARDERNGSQGILWATCPFLERESQQKPGRNQGT